MGFDHAILAIKQLQTYALDRTANGDRHLIHWALITQDFSVVKQTEGANFKRHLALDSWQSFCLHIG